MYCFLLKVRKNDCFLLKVRKSVIIFTILPILLGHSPQESGLNIGCGGYSFWSASDWMSAKLNQFGPTYICLSWSSSQLPWVVDPGDYSCDMILTGACGLHRKELRKDSSPALFRCLLWLNGHSAPYHPGLWFCRACKFDSHFFIYCRFDFFYPFPITLGRTHLERTSMQKGLRERYQ